MKTMIEPITPAVFREYGQVIQLPAPGEPAIAVENVNFWKQQAVLSVDGDVEIGVLSIRKMPMVFSELENHFESQTGLVCLSGDWAIGVATPGDEVPKSRELQAFRVPKFQYVILDEKCWHTGPYPVDHEEMTMLVFCKKNFLDDDTVYENIDQQVELTLS